MTPDSNKSFIANNAIANFFTRVELLGVESLFYFAKSERRIVCCTVKVEGARIFYSQEQYYADWAYQSHTVKIILHSSVLYSVCTDTKQILERKVL